MLNIVDVISKKRDCEKLTPEEIQFFVKGFTEGTVTDYQAAALAMAICINKMDIEEITQLTMAMRDSGETLRPQDVVDFCVDKHSTGGVGDKTTMIVQPIVSSCGVAVAKMSGRGLGYSGGTIDKLESIPGIRLDLSKEEFLEQLRTNRSVISGQSIALAPADGKLYALRDVTGTVPSQALIASSIMSKKLAIGTDAILLDVKVGRGAFMKNIEMARELASIMIGIGKGCGRMVRCEISDMNQPLGYQVGNILEVKEAVSFLKNEPGIAPDLYDHCIDSSAQLLMMASKADSLEEGRRMAKEAVTSGRAFESFCRLVRIQDGDEGYLQDPSRFPEAPLHRTITADRAGWIAEFDAEAVGQAGVELGGGRHRKTDTLDYRVGITVCQKVGSRVEKGDPLFVVHAHSEDTADFAQRHILDGIRISDTAVEPLPQFYGLMS